MSKTNPAKHCDCKMKNNNKRYVPLPWFMSKCNVGSSDMFIYFHIFNK
jgi:hypothetical protein